MSRILKKEVVENVNVYEASIKRFNYLFDNFDTVVVSFSGGKDSTVCLNLALQVAKEKNKLPLNVYFWDEEAIQPETIDYVERVRQNPDVKMKWICLPIKHRNACSRQEPYWYCWDPSKKDKWVRPMPDNPDVVTEMKAFKWGDSVPELAEYVYGPEFGTVADVRGIRADESLRRYRSVAQRTRDNWIGGARNNHNYPCSPIYDWTTFDVWTAPRKFGWDYNRSYDIMNMMGQMPSDQRVCPPYGEEPLSGLWIYAQGWPDMWHKMINRVHGASTAGKYAITELYGFGKLKVPDGKTWREWTYDLLELYPKALKAQIASNLAEIIAEHKRKTNRPIHDTDPDMVTGLSWKFLCMIANRGDLKNRRKGMVTIQADNARAKAGITLEQAMENEQETRY
jgi:predicted phosphoadenosine phosphosulfate sulfurtransferase|tara:strand:+ start:1917 stop:3104 length:1188 start_codon:yes stop_codon:yes gene_type:complete